MKTVDEMTISELQTYTQSYLQLLDKLGWTTGDDPLALIDVLKKAFASQYGNINNRIHNSSNPNQGEARKVLCVCSAGLLRSPTTANVLHQLYGFNTRAAGLVPEYALVPVDKVLLAWADEVVCMTEEQEKELKSMTDTPVQRLDIPDTYNWNDSRLVDCIKRAYDHEFMSSIFSDKTRPIVKKIDP